VVVCGQAEVNFALFVKIAADGRILGPCGFGGVPSRDGERGGLVAKARLAILSADTEVPYERPPPSKGFLAGKDSLETVRINPAEFYRERGSTCDCAAKWRASTPRRSNCISRSADRWGSTSW
jgi:hypothetical protein